MVCNASPGIGNENHLTFIMPRIVLVAAVLDYMLCLQTGPLITKYMESFYPPEKPCLNKIFFFNTSQNSNSTYQLKLHDDDQLSTDCRVDRHLYPGQGICFGYRSWKYYLKRGTTYNFTVIENTVDGRKLTSPDFPVKIGKPDSRPKDLLYLHAVTINGNSSSFVHLTWIQMIPPEVCELESLLHKIREYKLQTWSMFEVTLKHKHINFKHTDLTARIISNIPKFKYWSRCHTTIKYPRNHQQQKYQLTFKDLPKPHHTNITTLTDLSTFLPKPRCFMNGRDAVIQWQAPVNDSESTEVLAVPYTHYKLTAHHNGSQIRKILPLDVSQHKFMINGSEASGACPDVRLFLNICLWKYCTNRPFGCDPCDGSNGNGANPNVQPSVEGNQSRKSDSDWWYLSFLGVLPVAAIMFLWNYNRKKETSTTIATTTNVNDFVDQTVICPRTSSYSVPPRISDPDKGPALPPPTVLQHVYFHMPFKEPAQETYISLEKPVKMTTIQLEESAKETNISLGKPKKETNVPLEEACVMIRYITGEPCTRDK